MAAPSALHLHSSSTPSLNGSIGAQAPPPELKVPSDAHSPMDVDHVTPIARTHALSIADGADDSPFSESANEFVQVSLGTDAVHL